MEYFLKGPGAKPLEARVTIEGGTITLHSRSGKPRGSGPEVRGRNPDYVAAFDAIFDRLNVNSLAVENVFLDSSQAHKVPENERILATRDEFDTGVLHAVKNQLLARMRAFGRTPGMPPNEGNQNKKIRITTDLDDKEIIRRLRVVPAVAATGTTAAGGIGGPGAVVDPLPAAELYKVKAAHVVAALSRLDGGDPAANFDLSRSYDAMTGDGRRYAPKKVFGLALEEALGIEAMPGHFKGGWGTPCFDILEDAGLWIVSKNAKDARPRATAAKVAQAQSELIATDEERTWIEGNPKIATHLIKERSPGLAKKKRQQFVEDHGKLACERCGLDPVEEYGPEAGSACIEVHHHRTHVANMQPGHETSLDDLQCLCANCHRVLHRALALGVPLVAVDKPGAGASTLSDLM